MIKECNFKNKLNNKEYQCMMAIKAEPLTFTKTRGIINKETEEYTEYIQGKVYCPGEDNCILYQIYKDFHKVNHYGEYFAEQIVNRYENDLVYLPNENRTLPFHHIYQDKLLFVLLKSRPQNGARPIR